MYRTHKFLADVVFLFIAFPGGQAFAQGGATGAISGVVEDSSGAIIADAEVQINAGRLEVWDVASRLDTMPPNELESAVGAAAQGGSGETTARRESDSAGGDLPGRGEFI